MCCLCTHRSLLLFQHINYGTERCAGPLAELPPGAARPAPHRQRRGGARPPPPRGTRGRSSAAPLCHPGLRAAPAPLGRLCPHPPPPSADRWTRRCAAPPARRDRSPAPVGATRQRVRLAAALRGARRREGSAESWALARVGGGHPLVLSRWLPRLASALGWAAAVEGTRRPQPSSPWCSARAARAAPSSRSCSGNRGARIPSRREQSGCAQLEAARERQKNSLLQKGPTRSPRFWGRL